MNRELQFGTTNGIYMTIFFFKAIVLNEEAKTINAMTDYMEKFNRIGYQISQTPIEPIGFQRPEKSNFRAEAHAH